jgi:putative transposase
MMISELVERHNIIVIEDIPVSEIQERSLGKGMRKSYRDAGWAMAIGALCSKAAEAGCRVVRVNPAYTSQLCSECGTMVPKDLSVRRHVCPHCGLDIDRDLNAARNILRLGLQALRPDR